MEQRDYFKEATQLLKEKGCGLSEIMKVRKAFAEWGKQYDDDIEFSHKYQVWSSKLVKGYGFPTEDEVKFFNALYRLSPTSKPEKLTTVMGIIYKLLDIKSEYVFNAQ